MLGINLVLKKHLLNEENHKVNKSNGILKDQRVLYN